LVCAIPANLSVTNLTSSSATLNWDAVSGAASYKAHYKVTGTNQWTVNNSNGNSINPTNLSPDTKYNWQVKTLCTGLPGSDWSAKKSFHTPPLRLSKCAGTGNFISDLSQPCGIKQQFNSHLHKHRMYALKCLMLAERSRGAAYAELQQGEHSLPINTRHFTKRSLRGEVDF
jgi:hypothetical protein